MIQHFIGWLSLAVVAFLFIPVHAGIEPIEPAKPVIHLLPVQYLIARMQDIAIPTATQKRFISVLKCESDLKQFDKHGKVKTHHNDDGTIDIGFGQINQRNFQEAKSLGFDLASTTGNIDYSVWLLNHRGIKQWMCNDDV